MWSPGRAEHKVAAPYTGAMLDWATVSSLATAAGTLVLAVATFSSVRSANRAARVAERTLLINLRPLLAPSRIDDPVQKVGFFDNKWLMVPGGQAAAEASDEAVYLAMAIRNVGTGMALLHGWIFYPERNFGAGAHHPPPESFRRLTRDIIVPPGDVGFWQGAFRERSEPEFEMAREAVLERRQCMVDLLYGDHEGGQRAVTRFSMIPYGEDRWIATTGRHWNVDRPDPR